MKNDLFGVKENRVHVLLQSILFTVKSLPALLTKDN